jgi:hypothetical protein
MSLGSKPEVLNLVDVCGVGDASIGDDAKDGGSFVVVESVKRNLVEAFDEASDDVAVLSRKAVKVEKE